MEAITKFKAIDGKEFSDAVKCHEYEQLIDRVNEIMQLLHEKPTDDGCSFSNGGGYIQHDVAIARKVKIMLLNEIGKHIKHKWVQESINDETIHPSWVGRLLEERGIRPLENAWYRFCCMDSSGKEWGQPYFAMNPHEGKQIRIN